MQSEVVIETRNLTKVYRDFWGRQKVKALKALDIEVRKGEVFGLLGPNGSGKTTTMKLLLGLLFPTSGRAMVFGKDATEVEKNIVKQSEVGSGKGIYLLNAPRTTVTANQIFDNPGAGFTGIYLNYDSGTEGKGEGPPRDIRLVENEIYHSIRSQP